MACIQIKGSVRLILILFILCELQSIRTSSDQSELTASDFASPLVQGFKKHPLVVWTIRDELFCDLAETLIKVSNKQYHPVELWLEYHDGWRLPLKFAPGMPLYAIFPSKLAPHKNNIMLKMLKGFTECPMGSIIDNNYKQINEHIFLFISDTYNGNQENVTKMQDGKNNCLTPPQLLFLKYSFTNDEKTLIQLDSLSAIRVRCLRAKGYACVETVDEKDSFRILRTLSSEQVKNIVHIRWRKRERTHVIIVGLSDDDILERYGRRWGDLQRLFLNRRFRDLRCEVWTILASVPFFELVAKVNVTLSAPSNPSIFYATAVGYIFPQVLQGTFGISPSTLVLADRYYFAVLYSSDRSSSYNPLTGKSLSAACGSLEILIIFGLFLTITAIQIQKHRRRGVSNVIMNMIAPLVNQSPPHTVQKHDVLYFHWVVLIWFSTNLYLSLLESQRVLPTTQVGNDTFNDLLQRNISFYSDYVAYEYLNGENLKEQKRMFSTNDREKLHKLAPVLHQKPFMELPTVHEARHFFQLSNWALIVEPYHIKPMTTALTSFYSKDYNILSEKFYDTFLWSKISIPQADYVAETFKLIKESGIWDLWYEASRKGRDEDIDFGMRFMLKYDKTAVADSFQAMHTSDAVFLEIMTLFGLMVSVALTLFVGWFAWCRVRELIRSKVTKLNACGIERD